ncbi:hypothetical protein H9P43_005657 [Blastocladiella emersonii ATCC 22665]|nr:hypothetical protein H9P43_005657 [Blastocladiella emersonii ATCC 22665]
MDLFSANSSTTDGFSYEYDENRAKELTDTLLHVDDWIFGEIPALAKSVPPELANEAAQWKARFPQFRVRGEAIAIPPLLQPAASEDDGGDELAVVFGCQSLIPWDHIAEELQRMVVQEQRPPPLPPSTTDPAPLPNTTSSLQLTTVAQGTALDALPASLDPGTFCIARRDTHIYFYAAAGTTCQAYDLLLVFLEDPSTPPPLALSELESWDPEEPLGPDAVAVPLLTANVDHEIDLVHGSVACVAAIPDGEPGGHHHQGRRSVNSNFSSDDWTFGSSCDSNGWGLDDTASTMSWYADDEAGDDGAPLRVPRIDAAQPSWFGARPTTTGTHWRSLVHPATGGGGASAALPSIGSRPGTAAAHSVVPEGPSLSALMTVRQAPLHAKQAPIIAPPPLARPPSPLKRLSAHTSSLHPPARPRTGQTLPQPPPPPSLLHGAAGPPPSAHSRAAASSAFGPRVPSGDGTRGSGGAMRTAAWVGGQSGSFTAASRPSTATVRLTPLTYQRPSARIPSAAPPGYAPAPPPYDLAPDSVLTSRLGVVSASVSRGTPPKPSAVAAATGTGYRRTQSPGATGGGGSLARSRSPRPPPPPPSPPPPGDGYHASYPPLARASARPVPSAGPATYAAVVASSGNGTRPMSSAVYPRHLQMQYEADGGAHGGRHRGATAGTSEGGGTAAAADAFGRVVSAKTGRRIPLIVRR